MVLGLLRELRAAAQEDKPLVVAGAPALAEALRKELGVGGKPGWVRGGSPKGGAALVYLLAGEPSEEDRRVLREASRSGVPVVAVLAGPELDPRVPYVLATDVVRVPAGSGFPIDEIARRGAAGAAARRVRGADRALLAPERPHRRGRVPPGHGLPGADDEPAPPRPAPRGGPRRRGRPAARAGDPRGDRQRPGLPRDRPPGRRPRAGRGLGGEGRHRLRG